MRPLFFDQPIERVVFGVACAIWYTPELLGTFFQHAARRNGTCHDCGSYAVLIGVLWIGLPLGFGIAALVPWAAILVLRRPLFWLGIAGILAASPCAGMRSGCSAASLRATSPRSWAR